MKKIKFFSQLVPLILSGEKTSTWRVKDDKNLTQGDYLEFINTQTGQVFAQAKIIQIKIKKLADLTDEDFQGHERFSTQDELYSTYRKYYGSDVGPQTEIKMIDFQLV